MEEVEQFLVVTGVIYKVGMGTIKAQVAEADSSVVVVDGIQVLAGHHILHL